MAERGLGASPSYADQHGVARVGKKKGLSTAMAKSPFSRRLFAVTSSSDAGPSPSPSCSGASSPRSI